MLNERVVIEEESKSVREIVVEDVSFLGLFLDDGDAKILRFAQRSAEFILEKIKSREKSRCERWYMRVDVPRIELIAGKLPREEQACLLRFKSVYEALVGYLLPDANTNEYRLKNGTTGVSHVGRCWF